MQIRLGLPAVRTTLAQSLPQTFTQLRNLGEKPQLWGAAGRVKEAIGCFPQGEIRRLKKVYKVSVHRVFFISIFI